MEKKSNAKVFWYILFAFVTILLCYMSVVVYFFYISPYNVSMKVSIWPFLSSSSVSDMYLDATVEINFQVLDDITLEAENKSVVGVNVRKDGYIVAPYSDFRNCEENSIKIYANSGKIYNGKLLYGDINYNLAVLKCESVDSNAEEIKMSYVSISNLSRVSSEESVYAVSSPIGTKSFWTGIVETSTTLECSKTLELEGKSAVDFVMEECYYVELKTSTTDFESGVIFGDSGKFMGFGFSAEATTEDNEETTVTLMLPAKNVSLFLSNCVSAYQKNETYTNEIVKSIDGFDILELQCFDLVSKDNTDYDEYFYFDGTWQEYSDNVHKFLNSNTSGFYLFKDWTFDGQTILSADKVLSSIKVGSVTYSAKTKVDVFKALYNIETGDKITIFYYDLDSLGAKLESVSYTF